MSKVSCIFSQKLLNAVSVKATNTSSMNMPESAESIKGPQFEVTVRREEDAEAARAEFRRDVVEGLSKPQKSISSRYFYDDRGSELFAQITELQEYYLTRAETEVFETNAGAMVDYLSFGAQDEAINIIELGAGDGRKTKILLRELLDRKVNFEYFPIDISRQAMADLFEAMGTYFKNDALKVHGIIGDFFESIQHVVSLHPSRRSAVLFIGSSIGNFSMSEGKQFLSRVRSCLNPKDVLLLGVDLRKDLETMRKAYSDSMGVTQDFNLNLLTRMNRELGTDFDTGAFQHLAAYNPVLGAMESYLLATEPLTVTMKPDKTTSASSSTTSSEADGRARQFSFKSYEPIYMECSYKYTPESAQEMLIDSGFQVRKKYFDRKSRFLDLVAEVPNR